MICNERQYKITLKQVESLTAAMNSLSLAEGPDWLQVAQKDALRSQIRYLEGQLAEYSLIKEGKIRYSESADLSSLPKTLIQARIGKGFSQRDLAEMLNMPTQQIQRYEASDYMGASLARLIEVADVLGVSVRESWTGQNNVEGNSIFAWDDGSDIQWNEFPIKEMVKRGWLSLEHKRSPAETVKSYFNRAAGTQYLTALHRKKFHGVNAPNEYALLAWQARVLEKARKSVLEGGVEEFKSNEDWIGDLISLSVRENAPLIAQNLLASKGIILVIEKHLPKTYLDGAAMMLDTGHPVAALTLRYDRLDNFWFVLMHELGHVFRHLSNSLNMDFFDEDGQAENDDWEREADQFATDALIRPEQWELCLSRFTMTKEAVQLDASNLGVHPSIVAGRIRKERSNYSILADLLGQGTVRELFGEA